MCCPARRTCSSISTISRARRASDRNPAPTLQLHRHRCAIHRAELHRDLLMMGHQRILVLEPTLVAVRDALRLLGLPNGTSRCSRPACAQSAPSPRRAHASQQVEDALKMKVDVAIPDLPKLVENAATIGEPAALHGKFYKGIVALAAQAAAAFPVDSSPDGTSASVRRGWRRPWPVRHVSEEAPVWFGRRQTVVAAAPVQGGRTAAFADAAAAAGCGNRRIAHAVSWRDGSDLARKADARGTDPGSRAHARRDRHTAAHSAQRPRAARPRARTGQRYVGAWPPRAAARGRLDHRHHGQRP